MKVPNTKWRIRRDSDWTTESAEDYFAGKRSLVVSLPGAFTPTCSGMQLPSLEALYDDFKTKGIDEVYCLSVNDSFVMNAWAKDQAVENVKMIPDGAGHFTRSMGMLVEKPMQNFGMRSWRYSMIVDDGVITHFNEEPGRNDFSADDDPYEVSDPDTLLKQLGAKTFMQDITNNN